MRGRLQGTKLKNGKWRVRVAVTNPNGVKRYRAFERATQREAQEAAHQFIQAEGRTPPPILCGTVAEAIDAVDVALWKHLSPSTRKNYRLYGEKIKSVLGNRIVLEVTSPEITRYLSMYAHLSSRTVQEHVNVLQAAFSYAVSDLGWVKHNPVPGARKPKCAPGWDHAPLTREDFDRIFPYLPPHTHLFFKAWAWLGCRPSELWSITQDRIISRVDVWWFHVEVGKTAAAKRWVPLPDDMAHELRQDNPFPWLKVKYPRSTIRQIWEKAVAAHNAAEPDHPVQYTKPYAIRSMRLNEWRLQGFSDMVRKTTGGHGDIRVTKEFYDYPVMQEILDAFGMGKG
jgi:integrase